MLTWFIRALFVCASGGLGYQIAKLIGKTSAPYQPLSTTALFWGIIVGVFVSVIVIFFEAIFSKRPIQSISAVVFGLICGFLLAILFHEAILLAMPTEVQNTKRLYDYMKDANPNKQDRLYFNDLPAFRDMLKLTLFVIFSYVSVVVIYKTRDNFRFVIPYVEFQKEEKRARPILVDTSAIIDGRLSEICQTHVLDNPLVVPKFVIQELQKVADSPDRLRRNRGRRGLEVLNSIQRNEHVDVQIEDMRGAAGSNVDSKLVSMAAQRQARLITCDYNLSRIAELQDVEVININDLANALKPIKLPGEEVHVKVIRQGDEAGQGVGYLSDGTMVVIEQASDKIGKTVGLTVTSVLQTSAGRMIFGRIKEPA